MKKKQSITKVFVDDLATILTHIEMNKLSYASIFHFIDSQYPVALSLFIGRKISIETLRIIDDIYPILDDWSKHPTVKYIWEDDMRRIKKLTGFVKYDKIKVEKVFNHFKEEIAS